MSKSLNYSLAKEENVSAQNSGMLSDITQQGIPCLANMNFICVITAEELVLLSFAVSIK